MRLGVNKNAFPVLLSLLTTDYTYMIRYVTLSVNYFYIKIAKICKKEQASPAPYLLPIHDIALVFPF